MCNLPRERATAVFPLTEAVGNALTELGVERGRAGLGAVTPLGVAAAAPMSFYLAREGVSERMSLDGKGTVNRASGLPRRRSGDSDNSDEPAAKQPTVRSAGETRERLTTVKRPLAEVVQSGDFLQARLSARTVTQRAV